MNFAELPYLDYFEIEKVDINIDYLNYLGSKYGIVFPSNFIKFLSEVGNLSFNPQSNYILLPTIGDLTSSPFNGINNSIISEQIVEHFLSEKTILDQFPYFDIIINQKLIPIGDFCYTQRFLLIGYGDLNYNKIYVFDYEHSDHPSFVSENIEALFKEVLFVDEN